MRTTRIALVVATLWSLALVVAALTVPVYSGEAVGADSAGGATSTSTSATLVEVNGWWGLAVGVIPLAVSLVVGALLLGPGGQAPRLVALVIVLLLGIATVLSLLTVGIFIAPVTAALGIAVIVSFSGSAAARRPGPAGVGATP